MATLLTATRERDRRVNYHGTHIALIEAQARALGLRLTAFELPDGASNAVYAERLETALAPWRERGVRRVAYGDLHLADIRNFREQLTGRLGMQAVFPIWHQPCRSLVDELLHLGYRALITCVDTTRMPANFVGVELTAQLLDRFPDTVDPAGEIGEFHTFVRDGPTFDKPVTWHSQELRRENGFVYYMLG